LFCLLTTLIGWSWPLNLFLAFVSWLWAFATLLTLIGWPVAFGTFRTLVGWPWAFCSLMAIEALIVTFKLLRLVIGAFAWLGWIFAPGSWIFLLFVAV
jgi:hypothetical protein